MTKYESDIKTLNTSSQKAFDLLSDLSNFKQAVEKAKQIEGEKVKDYLKDVTFDNDSIKAKSHGIGEIGLKIVERETNKTIKFETENSPINANLWVQFVEKSETDTKMRMTLHAELPTMIKMMVDGKIKKGLNKIAESIAMAVNKVV